MEALKELEKFQIDRELNKQEFDLRIATMNIMKEVLEAHGVHDNAQRYLVKELHGDILNIVRKVANTEDVYTRFGYKYSEPTIEEQVDAFCDIQVFAGGEVMKLGYSNEQC